MHSLNLCERIYPRTLTVSINMKCIYISETYVLFGWGSWELFQSVLAYGQSIKTQKTEIRRGKEKEEKKN